jgi:2'-5' RNA ligase
MKGLQKYFLALVPPPQILAKVHEIKIALRDQFGIKYALKSPPHITLKMPFSYNEAKEEQLLNSLQLHLQDQKPFRVKIDGVSTFGNRVVFLSIPRSEELMHLQHDVCKFSKTRLHLTEELSDRNYHPHMTVAFKDIKASHFKEILGFVTAWGFTTEFDVKGVTLLKRIDGSWRLQGNALIGVDV